MTVAEMGNILYLVHRLPYPPNKGDKVRSYHLLRHLTRRHQVYLGTFVDDPDDLQHVGTLASQVAGLHVARLNPWQARLRCLAGLIDGRPLTLPYYDDAGLRTWVESVRTSIPIDATVIFSSSMGQYATFAQGETTLVDFIDVDSAKWSQYSRERPWPKSWVFEREARSLLAYEREVTLKATRSFFTTDKECALFAKLAPDCASLVEPMCNGVDAEYFAPDHDFESPYDADERTVVFTGAMDYWPNIDAVKWFVEGVLPRLREAWPQVCFYVVGRAPSPEVLALQGDAVKVTGTVDDVRPYLRHAEVVVAPLRVARGIQNKVLEAMAMARAVVASNACAGAVDAVVERDFLAAESAEEFAGRIDSLLRDPAAAERIGRAGRALVESRYSWDAHLSAIDKYIPGAP